MTDDNALDNLSFDKPSRDDITREDVANLAQRADVKRPDLEKSVSTNKDASFRTTDASATDVKPDASTKTDATQTAGLDSTSSAVKTDVNVANKAELSSQTADVRTALENRVANTDRTKAELAAKAERARLDQKQKQDSAGKTAGDANRVEDTRKSYHTEERGEHGTQLKFGPIPKYKLCLPKYQLFLPTYQLFLPAYQFVLPTYQFFLPEHQVVLPK